MSQPPQGPPPQGPLDAQPAGQAPWAPEPGAGWGIPPVGQPSAGGWGPPPGQPGTWGAPGGPAPWGEGAGGPGAPGPDRKRTLVVTAAAAVALLAVVAVGLVLWLKGGGDEEAPTAAGHSAETSTSASRPAAPSSSAGAEAFSASPSISVTEFLASLPDDFAECSEAEPIGDGDVVAAACGAASTQPGPTDAMFLRYPDVDTLDDVFVADVGGLGLEEWAGATDCTEDGYGVWARGEGGAGGLLGCGLTDGTAFLYWTDDEFLTEGVVSAPGETQDDVVALYEWWVENSDFVS